jgi:rhamnulokinase
MSGAASNYLAFDLGGSGGKLFLCRFDGERLGLEAVHAFDHEPIAVSGGLYWDLLRIYSEMNAGVRRASGLAEGPIRSMGIDSFSNDFALVDARGELLTQLRCYRDDRTERYREAIYARMSPERLYELTGNQVAPFNTLMQLAAMREAGQGYLLDNAHKLLFTPDLLIRFMTGVEASEYTISSVSQMYDPAREDWSEEILGAFGIPRRLLCDIARPGSILGGTSAAYERELGIGGFDLVSVCEHDTASAFLAATTGGERAVISSGTWSLVGTEVPAPIIGREGFQLNIANEGGFGGRHRLLRNVMGLWIVQEIGRQLEARGECLGYSGMAAAAERSRPFAFRIDPDHGDFFAPADMMSQVARHCARNGGGQPRDPGETLRCVFESLAFKYRWAVEKIEGLTGLPLAAVNVVGGGSKNALLCQFTANACGRPVLAGPSDATALGNLLVQLLADRRISSIEEGKELIARSFPLVEYLPEETERWEEEYCAFKAGLALP